MFRNTKDLWHDLLEIVYPWRCPLCRGEGDPPTGLCPECRAGLGTAASWRCPVCGRPLVSLGGCCPQPSDHPLDGLFSVADYGDAVRTLIHLHKYSRAGRAGRALGIIFSEEVESSLDVPCDMIVPVPLSRARQRQRGFNQAALMGRRLGRKMSLPVGYDVLKRVRHAQAQAELSGREREENVSRAFTRGRGAGPPGRCLLVDDVYTTGATMRDCARVLKEGGAQQVFGAVFACAVMRDQGGPGIG